MARGTDTDFAGHWQAGTQLKDGRRTTQTATWIMIASAGLVTAGHESRNLELQVQVPSQRLKPSTVTASDSEAAERERAETPLTLHWQRPETRATP